MKEIVEGKLYDTDTAEIIADNHYWDGHNFERRGRNRFLYKTEKGNFFLHETTLFQGEFDRITPITVDQAKRYYEELQEKHVEYVDTFGQEPEIA